MTRNDVSIWVKAHRYRVEIILIVLVIFTLIVGLVNLELFSLLMAIWGVVLIMAIIDALMGALFG